MGGGDGARRRPDPETPVASASSAAGRGFLIRGAAVVDPCGYEALVMESPSSAERECRGAQWHDPRRVALPALLPCPLPAAPTLWILLQMCRCALPYGLAGHY